MIVTARRIEMVLPSLIAAGMEMVTSRLAMSLRGRGWVVGVTCLMEDGEMADDLRAAGIRVRTVQEPGFAGNFWPRHLVPWMAGQSADVVHVHSGAWIKGAHAARLAGCQRVVFTEHGLLPHEPWYSDLLKRWGASYCDYVVAVSDPLASHLARAGVPQRKLRVILNGVDTQRFSPGRARATDRGIRARLGIGDAPLIGHVARLAPEKNQALLLEAFAAVLVRHPSAHLVIAGDGPLRRELETQRTELSLDASVHFLGVWREMEDLYRDMDVFVLPSLAEGTSISILEAMASGCAVVASAVGGTPALLDHGACGDLVSSTDSAAVASAISAMLSSEQQRVRFGVAARDRAVTHFSEDAMVDAYIALYDSRTSSRSVERAVCAG